MHPTRTCDSRGCGLLQPGMLAQFAKLEIIDRINVLVLFLKRKLLCLSVKRIIFSSTSTYTLKVYNAITFRYN